MNVWNTGAGLRQAVSDSRSSRLLILAICAALLVILVASRVVILLPELSVGAVTDGFDNLFAGILQDLLLSLAIAAAALAAHAALPRVRRAAIVWATLAIGTLIAAYAVANVEIVRILGEPLTVDWLRYSDFLSGAINGILYSVSGHGLFLALAIPVAFTALSATCAAILLHLDRLAPRLTAGAGCLAVVALVYAGVSATPTAPQAKLSNPVLAFAKSAMFAARTGLDDAEAAPHPFGIGENIRRATEAGAAPLDRARLAGIENVILFVMESVPAEYVYDYASAQPVTPNISRYSSRALRFENIYAHAPATNYSLFSLLTSIVPELSSTGMTEKYPRLPLASIANVLSGRGYRTAYIGSSDSRFQSTDLFLGNKGFDVVEDYRDWTCDRVYKNSDEKWRYMDFSSDLCTVDRLTDWIAKEPGRRFFGMLWTGMTHYPYFPEGEQKRYVEDEGLNRYLNSLRVGDEAFGKLMAFLEEQNLAKKTLVVVVGDHGEAFGRHGTYVHASAIYEENVHIPLLLVNEAAFSGDRASVVGGATDVAPTILDVLDIPRPELWQGSSLFAADRPGRVYFFSPWNGFKVGYREGSRKFIYNSDSRRLETYDLSTDPHEARNLTKVGDGESERALKNIASWVRYQTGVIDEIVLGQSNVRKVAASAGKASIRVSATGTSFRTPPRARVDVDGATLGFFDVAAAPKNAEKVAGDAAIAEAVTVFDFPLPPGTCPKRVQIAFLNDEWDEQNKIGDTNLFIQDVEVNGVGFSADDLEADTPDAASKYRGYMALWRWGSVRLDVDAVRICG